MYCWSPDNLSTVYWSPRYDVHVFMSLSHGKVGETCARMAIAERMLEVCVYGRGLGLQSKLACMKIKEN